MELYFTHFKYLTENLEFGPRLPAEMHQMQTSSVSGEQDGVEMHPKTKELSTKPRISALQYCTLHCKFYFSQSQWILLLIIFVRMFYWYPYRENSIAASIMSSSYKCLIAYTHCYLWYGIKIAIIHSKGRQLKYFKCNK